MGVILDSSVIIAGERRGDRVAQLISRVLGSVGDQDLALSSVGLTELVHGIYRGQSTQQRFQRKAYIDELVDLLPVYPYTARTAFLAGRLDGQQQAKGITIPYPDLLIGATALERNFAVLTSNLRHFRLIPHLEVLAF